MREARVVAQNIHAVTVGRAPAPFIFHTIGIMSACGRMSAAADVRDFHLTGFPAWWLRRSYYLLQMPRWDTRLRIVFDWTVALFFRSEPTVLSLTAEREQRSLGSSGRTKIVGDAITGRSLARGTRRTLELIDATLKSSASVAAMQ